MNPWPISPVAKTDLDFAVVNYDFTTFTGNEEKDLPSIETAIDLSLLDFAASIVDQTTLIASLFDGFDDLGIIPGEIDSSDNIGNTLSDLSNAAAAGDATLGDYTGQIGSNSGGGGGGGTPACTTNPPGGGSCAVAADFPGVNCWAGLDLTDVQATIKIPQTYFIGVAVQEKSGNVAVVTGASLFQRDDTQWESVTFSTGPCGETGKPCGFQVAFTPRRAGKTRCVAQVECTTDPTTRFICMEIRVSGG